MAKINQDMIYRDHRVKTFEESQIVKERSFLWEDHTDVVNVDILINAGFYYNPIRRYKTRVTCTYCGHSSYINSQNDLDKILYKHKRANSSCPMNQILEMVKLTSNVKNNPHAIKRLWQKNQNFMDPSSSESQAFREQFFINYPLDKIDSVPNSRSLSKSGFIYSPRSIEDDRVTCMYCQCALDFWEVDDDPIQEHIKNEQGYCYFLDTLHKSTTGHILSEVSNKSIVLDETTKSIEESKKEVSDSQDEQDEEDSKVDDLSIVEVSRNTKDDKTKNSTSILSESDIGSENDIVEIQEIQEQNMTHQNEIKEDSMLVDETSNQRADVSNDELPDFDEQINDENTNSHFNNSLLSPNTSRSKNLSIIKLPVRETSEQPVTYRRSKRIKRLYSERDRNVDYWDKIPDDDLLQEFIDVSQKSTSSKRDKQKQRDSDSVDDQIKSADRQLELDVSEQHAQNDDFDIPMNEPDNIEEDKDVQEMLDIEEIIKPETRSESLDEENHKDIESEEENHKEIESEEENHKDIESEEEVSTTDAEHKSKPSLEKEVSDIELESEVEISDSRHVTNENENNENNLESDSGNEKHGSESEDEESSEGEQLDSEYESENESSEIPEPVDELYEVTESSDDSIDVFETLRKKPKSANKRNKEPTPKVETKTKPEPKQPRKITITRREKSTTPLPSLFDDSSDNFEYDEKHVEKLESQVAKKPVGRKSDEPIIKNILPVSKNPSPPRKLSITADQKSTGKHNSSPIRFLDGLKESKTKRRKVSKPNILDMSFESAQKFSSPIRFSQSKKENGIIAKSHDEKELGSNNKVKNESPSNDDKSHDSNDEVKDVSNLLKDIDSDVDSSQSIDKKSDSVISKESDHAVEDSPKKESELIDPDASYDVLFDNGEEDDKEDQNEVYVDADPDGKHDLSKRMATVDKAVEQVISSRDKIERLSTPHIEEIQGTSTSNNSRIDLDDEDVESVDDLPLDKPNAESDDVIVDDTNSIEELVTSEEEEGGDVVQESDSKIQKDNVSNLNDSSPKKLYLDTIEFDKSPVKENIEPQEVCPDSNREEDTVDILLSMEPKASPARGRSRESTKDLKKEQVDINSVESESESESEFESEKEITAESNLLQNVAKKEENSISQKEETDKVKQATEINDISNHTHSDQRIDSPRAVINKRISFKDLVTSPLAMNSSLSHIHKQEEETTKEERVSVNAPQKRWEPRPLTKFVEQIKFLESSAKELKELANSEYDLNNDVNGDITRFIAEMPEEEEEMTIKQWIEHCATNCRDIVTQSCSELGDFILEEYDRAIQEIESMPTID